MANQRLRLALLAMLSFAVVTFLAIALFAGSLISQESKKMIDLKLQSKTVDAQLSSLAQSKKAVQQYAYFNKIAKTVLPSDKDQAQAVLDIFQLAGQAGISLQTVTFPASSLGANPAAPATTSNAATAPVQTVISQAKPVDGLPGLYGIELTVTHTADVNAPPAVQATYDQLLSFLKAIERDRRTAQITQVSIDPLLKDGFSTPYINFSLKINIFIKP